MKTTGEFFVLEDNKGPILYAPFGQKIARINEGTLSAISKYLDDDKLDAVEQNAIDMLNEHQFLTSPVEAIEDEPFSPTHVTLFPSNGCNLRCSYCYAAAEDIKQRMDMDMGKAAVDFVAGNAIRDEKPSFSVGFHGNGEPFTAYGELVEICDYAKETAAAHNLNLALSVATNGVLNEAQQDYLLANFTNVNISFDGLPELQNRQRPYANGKGSAAAVEATLKRLDAAGSEYGIRSTVTAETVAYLPDMVAYVVEHYPNCTQLHIEPVWESGRCYETGEKMPLEERYIEAYLKGSEVLGDHPTSLTFSGARQDLVSNSFCAVSTGGFTVTVDGYVTSCYEVCTTEDERYKRYFYGKYNHDERTFEFDEDRLKALSQLKVENMPYCEDCFCKWHCAGDCAAKVLGLKAPSDHSGSPRCKITRALTLHQIQRKLICEEV